MDGRAAALRRLRGPHRLVLLRDKRIQVFDVAVHAVCRNVAHLEVELTVLRYDVGRDAALYDGGVHRCVRHLIALFEGAFLRQPLTQCEEVREHLRRGLQRVVAGGLQRAVRRQALALVHHEGDALVRDDELQAGWLAHDAALALMLLNLAEDERRSHHGGLLVVRKGEVDRFLQCPALPQQLRHEGEGDRDEALHVAGAAAVQSAVALHHPEGVRAPALPRHRHDVRVAAERDAAARAAVAGGDGREEVRVDVGAGLRRGRALHVDVLRAQPAVAQVLCDPLDERQVGAVADRVEADELTQDLLLARGGHGVRACLYTLKSNTMGEDGGKNGR
ncbi:acetylornithine deacetylase [Strigomonas culicis]|uniref:Acetylornithine deacetylase n=1 Tax=Strigomonas culicis TaxID=28005 RepID=S9VWA3_9TRYP|nr:acetylornithine deacetylase [Strigomonas culicis]|eukprot:EPY27805.1 acetylornithine deacetylase [Strigomonas culicis]